MTRSAVTQVSEVASHERAFVERATAGDRDAYDALVQPRIDSLYRTAFGILREEADARDAVQDACVLAWRELARLREAERFDAWLARILVNTCRDRLRSRRRVQVREIDIAALSDRPGEPVSPVVPLAQRVADADAVRRAFKRLKPDERIVLALHHADERSIAEMAVLLGAPAGTVKWRLHAARQSLVRALEHER